MSALAPGFRKSDSQKPDSTKSDALFTGKAYPGIYLGFLFETLGTLRLKRGYLLGYFTLDAGDCDFIFCQFCWR